jgi:hypothetical protein
MIARIERWAGNSRRSNAASARKRVGHRPGIARPRRVLKPAQTQHHNQRAPVPTRLRLQRHRHSAGQHRPSGTVIAEEESAATVHAITTCIAGSMDNPITPGRSRLTGSPAPCGWASRCCLRGRGDLPGPMAAGSGLRTRPVRLRLRPPSGVAELGLWWPI